MRKNKVGDGLAASSREASLFMKQDAACEGDQVESWAATKVSARNTLCCPAGAGQRIQEAAEVDIFAQSPRRELKGCRGRQAYINVAF